MAATSDNGAARKSVSSLVDHGSVRAAASHFNKLLPSEMEKVEAARVEALKEQGSVSSARRSRVSVTATLDNVEEALSSTPATVANGSSHKRKTSRPRNSGQDKFPQSGQGQTATAEARDFDISTPRCVSTSEATNVDISTPEVCLHVDQAAGILYHWGAAEEGQPTLEESSSDWEPPAEGGSYSEWVTNAPAEETPTQTLAGKVRDALLCGCYGRKPTRISGNKAPMPALRLDGAI